MKENKSIEMNIFSNPILIIGRYFMASSYMDLRLVQIHHARMTTRKRNEEFKTNLVNPIHFYLGGEKIPFKSYQ